MMTSLFLPDMLQTDKHLHFLSLVAYHSGIWYFGTYFVAYWSHCMKKGKISHGSSNNDIINLKAMIKRYTFSSILQVLWAATLKRGILGSFVLLMTNNYKFVSKKVKYVYRLCNDDVIIVPDMLHRDIQQYYPSHLVTIFVDDLPHYIKKREKTNCRQI